MNKYLVFVLLGGALLMLGVRRASATGLDYIRQFESLELEPYQDIAGKWTIGYGHLILPGESFTRITQAAAEFIFRNDVAIAEGAINELVTVPLSQNQYDALTSFVFNLGRENFRTSTLLKKLNAGDYAGAGDELLRWNKATVDGVFRVVSGLTNRRTEERLTWMA